MTFLPPAMQRMLMPGEIVRWTARPRARPSFAPADIFPIFWGVFGIAFGLLFLATAAWTDFPLPFRLVPALFAVIGVYAAIGLPLLNYWVQSELYYALTDKRVIVFLDGPFGRTKSQSLSNLPALELTEQTGGRGSVMFCPKDDNYFTRGWRDFVPSAFRDGLQFYNIADARTVYRLVEQEVARRH